MMQTYSWTIFSSVNFC